MRILFIGDIVGKPGRKIVAQALPGLRKREQLDLVIANAENAADGSGITPKIYRELMVAGVDCITLGDHIYRRFEITNVLESEANIIKPANYPEEAPGRNWAVVEAANGVSVAVISVLGRVYMRPVDCPFKALDHVLAEIPPEVKVRFVDIHAEATSDKQVIGRYLDGRVSAAIGTHTHVPTADEQLFPGGTAFQCDVGMTGPYESILGRKIDRVTHATITFRPIPFQVATDDIRIGGAIVDVDPDTGNATAIKRVMINEQEAAELQCAISSPMNSTVL
ncbi:MAG: TIGR00282 family metallophosphoesterase [Planctomycetaceae bacterium]|nr:TIGR00282 family metallophosphoesterase [Planctomycetales bacterium]MCB9927311.1 TIGR00282 family metallophosphoesterase [Planctomycetaceae bacterium]